MTAQQYVSLSTRLVGDLQQWLLESAEHNPLTREELDVLERASTIVQRITLREAHERAASEPEGGTIII